MRSPRYEGIAWVIALLLALPPFILPLFNPDLFWHLSAGSWMFAHGAIVREDFLSFTRNGLPWSDFEWLSQVLYYGLYAAGGLAGLFAVKVVLLAASALTLLALLRLYKIPPMFRAGGLVIWSAATLSHADVRPDLFSTLLFGIVLYILERGRLGRRVRHETALFFGLFTLWVNLHAGFAFGLALIGFYGLAAALEGKRGEAGRRLIPLLAAFAGTFVNPFGAAPYLVMADHWKNREILAVAIQEWQPMTFTNLFHLPFWPLLAATLGSLIMRMRSKTLPLGLALTALLLGFEGVRHTRLAAYFTVLAVPLLLLNCRDAGWLSGKKPTLALGGAALAYACFLISVLPQVRWPGLFDPRHVPVKAAAYLERERAVFEGLRTYNPWAWGGYLGWRLRPWHKVFGDGRYIFHYQLQDLQSALSESVKTHEYMEASAIEAAVLLNVPSRIETVRGYPDGSRKVFFRPWFISYFPREKWALVYWDDKALIFVARDRVPGDWLEKKEFRYARPYDDAAFNDAIARQELPVARVKEEIMRHERENREFADAPL